MRRHKVVNRCLVVLVMCMKLDENSVQDGVERSLGKFYTYSSKSYDS